MVPWETSMAAWLCCRKPSIAKTSTCLRQEPWPTSSPCSRTSARKRSFSRSTRSESRIDESQGTSAARLAGLDILVNRSMKYGRFIGGGMEFSKVHRQASASPDAGSRYKIPSQGRRGASALPPAWSLASILLLSSCAAPCLAGTVQQLTDSKITTIGAGLPGTDSSTGAASLDDAGTAVYVNAGTNQLGGNPEHRYQIFRF